MIAVLRSWLELVRLPRFGPKALAASLALGAVVLWATWPTLATWAQPAPPFLVLSLAAPVGFCVSIIPALASGCMGAFVRTSPMTILLVAAGPQITTSSTFWPCPGLGLPRQT